MLAESQNLMVVCDSFQRHSLYSVIFCCNNQYSFLCLLCAVIHVKMFHKLSSLLFTSIFCFPPKSKGCLHFLKRFILRPVITPVVYLWLPPPPSIAVLALFWSNFFHQIGKCFFNKAVPFSFLWLPVPATRHLTQIFSSKGKKRKQPRKKVFLLHWIMQDFGQPP